LASHDELLTLMVKIKSHPDMTRAELVRNVFHAGGADTGNLLPLTDQERAFSMGASLLLLMGFDASAGPDDFFEDLILPFPWRDCVSAEDYITKAFSRRSSSHVDSVGQANQTWNAAAALTAVNMIKNSELRFMTTNDLRAHFTLDHEGFVRVYDCTAVPKELLLATLEDPDAFIIPRPLVLEVLHTVHNALFHQTERPKLFSQTSFRSTVSMQT
jgi:hypothetical protein